MQLIHPLFIQQIFTERPHQKAFGLPSDPFPHPKVMKLKGGERVGPGSQSAQPNTVHMRLLMILDHPA